MGYLELNNLVLLVEKINQDIPVRWDIPIEIGKWSINEIISHIWLWDKYSLSLMLPLARQGVSLKFIDQRVINYNAESFAKTLKNNAELIELFKETRYELIAKCKSVSEDLHFYVGNKELNIESYVKKFITSHDKHHIKQIEEFIKRTGYAAG